MKKREHYVTCGQMKILEKRADEAGLSYYQMMENAGARAAELILRETPYRGIVSEDVPKDGSGDFRKVAESPISDLFSENPAKSVKLANSDIEAFLFCGKGNNGGDGFVVARLLCKAGCRVTVILVDGKPKTEDSITNFGLLQNLPVRILDMAVDDRVLMELKETPDLIVDAIYGTGFHGVLGGNALKAAMYINKFNKLAAAEMAEKEILIFSLDIPSGMGGDLTNEKRLDPASIRAHYTITFHARKPVHLQNFAAAYCGQIIVADIGIDEEALWHVEI